MASLMTLELHFPSNWACEGTVDVLYVDGGNSSEKSYGTLAQGQHMVRETYPGHRWNVREFVSRELLMSIIAAAPSGGGAQVVSIFPTYAHDPLRSALWTMGKAPREPLLKAVDLLTKILQNVLKAPEEPKYRSLRAANEKIAAALDVSGVLSLLAFAGFEQSFADGEAKLILNQGAPLSPVEGAASQLKRLDALLKGLPLNGPQGVAHVAATPAAHEESSHRCSACGKGIDNDLRRKLGGNGEIGGWRTSQWGGGGEYRFHCSSCNADLCSSCYDRWKAGSVCSGSSSATAASSEPVGAAVHPLSCSFTIEEPITSLHWRPGGLPPPPPVNSRNRRGPWG